MALKSYREMLPAEFQLPDDILTSAQNDLRYIQKKERAWDTTHFMGKTFDEAFAGTQIRAIALGTSDLNTRTSPSEYYQDSNANTSTARHYPENLAGHLSVKKGAGIIQEYHVYNTTRVWRRSFYANIWGDWKKTYDTANKPTKSDVGLDKVQNYDFVNSYTDSSPYKYASAAAVKSAYDLAASKITKAQGDVWYLGIRGKAEDSKLLNGYTHNTAAVASSIVLRDGSGDVNARLVRSSYNNDSTIAGGAGIVFRVNNTSDNYLRICNNMSVVRTHIGLGNVNNWTATTSTTDASNTKYFIASGAKNLQDQVNNKISNGGTCSTVYATNWFRAKGQTGLYCEDFGGGIYMVDTTWLRVYGSKKFYVQNEIAATGEITAYYSDKRLKKDLKPVRNASAIIGQWNAYHYHANKLACELGNYDVNKLEIGLLAQDIAATNPELTTLAPFDKSGDGTSKSGKNYLTIKYDRLTAMLVNAHNEHTEYIKTLEERVDVLTGTVTRLLNALK